MLRAEDMMPEDGEDLSLAPITREFFKGRVRCINMGECFVWAWIAKLYYPKAALCRDSTGNHAFIKLGRRYYDSDSPEGVKDWKQLHSYRRDDISGARLIKYKHPGRFIRYWQQPD